MIMLFSMFSCTEAPSASTVVEEAEAAPARATMPPGRTARPGQGGGQRRENGPQPVNPATGVVGPSPVPPPGQVDVYLAAGPEDDLGACQFSPRSYASTTNCSLWRLRWDLGAATAVDHASVVQSYDQIGASMPTIDRTGQWLGYIRGNKSIGNSVFVKPTGSSSGLDHGVEWTVGAGTVRFPTWLHDGTVLYGTSDRTAACVTADGRCERRPYWSNIGQVREGQEPALFLGSGAGGGSWSDPAQNPVDPRYLAMHASFVEGDVDAYPTCDPSSGLGTQCSLVPVREAPTLTVMDMTDRSSWRYHLTNDEPERSVPLSGCGHAAWSPDGKTLLCTEHKTKALDEVGVASRLYRVAFDPTAPKGDVNLRTAPLFPHAPVRDLFPLPEGQACSELVYKYAEFCADPGLVVATVTCDCATPACLERAREGSPSWVAFARILLVDFREPGVSRVHDLTGALEQRLSATTGDLRSFTATCRGPA
jgi:hypothetical protein